MTIRIRGHHIGFGIIALILFWPFLTYPFNSESFFNTEEALDTSVAQGWRMVMTIILLLAGGIGSIALIGGLVTNEVDVDIKINLPPFKKKIFSNNDIKRK